MKIKNQTIHQESSTVYLSKKGLKDLEKSITQLEKDHERALSELKSIDDIDSHEGRLTRIEKLAQIDKLEKELAENRALLLKAKLLPRKRDALRVALGSVVELADSSGRMMRYTLVNSFEANPSDGRISVESPLGRNLLGKTIKQTVEWGNGLRTHRMKLVNIA